MTPSIRQGVVVTTTTLVVLAAVLYVLLARPFASTGMPLHAEFGRAGQGLQDDSPVKIRGVQVGSVSDVRLRPDGRALLTLRLNPGVRVPVTATAAIEPASVFGPKYVNVIPGGDESNGPFLAADAVITKTSDPNDLADLLSDTAGAIQAVDPAEVAIIVRTVADGLNGQGPALRAILEDTGTLIGVAHEHRHDARTFLHDGADLSAALAGAAPDLVQITAGTNDVITTVASAGEGNLGAFVTGLGDVSALIAHGLDKRGGQVREAFRSSERLVALLYGQLGDLGDAVRAANRLLPVYNDLAKLPAADGKHYLGVQAYLPSSPCDLILGLCGRR